MKSGIVSTVWVWLSVLISFLVTIASVFGIFDSKTYSYESANWALQAVGQDIGNLIAVPVFLISTYFLTKRSPRVLFVWLGALLYFIYAYLVYAFFIHFGSLFLVYVAVLGLSFYTFVGALIEQDISAFAGGLKNSRYNTLAGTLLVLIGLLFGALWLAEIVPALLSGQKPQSLITANVWVNPIHVIDLAFVLPGMILVGVLLWRKKVLGYFFAPPWLTFSALMGSSIVVTMIMELKQGNSEALVPMVMVGVVVISSLLVLWGYLTKNKL